VYFIDNFAAPVKNASLKIHWLYITRT